MAVLNPHHLFEQAARLARPALAGPPRQVDIRRAISAAYYSVFHDVLRALADEFAGATKRASPMYALVYRSIDHRALRELCNETKKPQMAVKYRKYVPANGLSGDMRVFASALIELQEKRHTADYNPSIRLKMSDASLAINTAKMAIARFRSASASSRKIFLTLALCPPR